MQVIPSNAQYASGGGGSGSVSGGGSDDKTMMYIYLGAAAGVVVLAFCCTFWICLVYQKRCEKQSCGKAWLCSCLLAFCVAYLAWKYIGQKLLKRGLQEGAGGGGGPPDV